MLNGRNKRLQRLVSDRHMANLDDGACQVLSHSVYYPDPGTDTTQVLKISRRHLAYSHGVNLPLRPAAGYLGRCQEMTLVQS
eukprot:1709042-Amphidinium_carterae.2